MDNGASSYRRFIDGDENGLEEIIRDYKDGLILYLNGFTKNIYVAEELMEETFVKLVVKKPRFSHKCSFKTWLYTIGRNVAIDYHRHPDKNAHIAVEDLQHILQDEKILEQTYLQEEQKITLHKAMNTLNPAYQQVLYLSFFEDFSNVQIAAIMKKSKRQIENLLYRAKQSLKAELNKEGFVQRTKTQPGANRP